MDIELVIDASSTEVHIALLKDKVLTELHKEKSNKDFSVGDIYFGKVRKVVPSLNAAFVDVGYERDAFLHYYDLGPQFSSLKKYIKQTISGKQNTHELTRFKQEQDIDKNGKIKDILSPNQNLLVQIAKEPISQKGPRLTSELTLAGRYLVLVPFSNKVSISQNIRNRSERERLKRLLNSIKPQNFGVIIRTVAENKKVAELDNDLHDLMERWQKCYQSLKSAKPPQKVLGELNKTSAILRDLLNEKFTKIHVNDEGLYHEIRDYIAGIAPGQENIVKQYSGKADIFDQFGIQKQIKSSFGKHVPLPSGAYLIIEHTEAMHVVDVNSGGRKSPGKDQEQNALVTNLEAAEELARIFKLRDMGGIIAVDFIDMYENANQRKLFDKMKALMKSDRAKHNVLPPSKFGVVEITRERVRPETDIKTSEKCPSCEGTGEVQATILVVDEIENNLRYLFEDLQKKKVILCVHPFINAYLKSGLPSLQMRWWKKFRKWVSIRPMTAYHFLEYHFFDGSDEEIEI